MQSYPKKRGQNVFYESLANDIKEFTDNNKLGKIVFFGSS